MYWSQDGLNFCFDVWLDDFLHVRLQLRLPVPNHFMCLCLAEMCPGSALAPFCHAVQRGFVDCQQVVANFKVNGFFSSLRQEMMCLVEKMKSRSCIGRLATVSSGNFMSRKFEALANISTKALSLQSWKIYHFTWLNCEVIPCELVVCLRDMGQVFYLSLNCMHRAPKQDPHAVQSQSFFLPDCRLPSLNRGKKRANRSIQAAEVFKASWVIPARRLKLFRSRNTWTAMIAYLQSFYF